MLSLIDIPYTIIQQALDLEQHAGELNKSFFSIFKKDKLRTRYRIFLAWCIQFMNQASGIVLVVYYLPSILQNSVGLSHRTALIIPGFAVCMFVIGVGLWLAWCLHAFHRCSPVTSDGGATTRGTNFAAASVAFFFLYLLAFGASVNCVPWVFVPEILPLQARTRGTAIGVSSNWLWNFTIAMISPVILNRLQWKAYLIFMACNFISVPCIYFFYPETSNLRLEDIDHIFAEGGNPVSRARKMQECLKAGISPTGEPDEEQAYSKHEGGAQTIESVP